jgi:hypothetical protein
MLSDYDIKRRNEKCFGIAKPEEKKVLPKISVMSAKRQAQQRLYRKIVKEMLEENNICEIKAIGCTGIAEGLQHKVKRSSKNLLDRKNLLRSCNHCNTWIESNPLEAIAMGVSASKFKDYEPETKS